MKEIKSLTGLRGLAAIWVFFVHSGIVAPQGYVGSKFPLLKNFFAFGTVSVDMFFLLSGYLLASTHKDKFKILNFISIKSFMIKRFARIYPLYVFVLLCAILFYKPINYDFNYNKRFLTCIANFFLIQTPIGINNILGPAWSLSCEWLMYFSFPLFCCFLSRNDKRINFFILFMLLIVIQSLCSSILAHSLQIKIPQETSGELAMIRSLFSFLLGMILFFNNNKFNFLYKYSFVIVTFLVIFSLFLNYTIVVYFINPLLLLSIKDDKGLFSRFCSWRYIYNLGLYSFGFYLIHPFFLDLIKEPLNNLLKTIPILSHVAYPISIFLIIIFIYLIAKFLYYYLELRGKNLILKLNK